MAKKRSGGRHIDMRPGDRINVKPAWEERLKGIGAALGAAAGEFLKANPDAVEIRAELAGAEGDHFLALLDAGANKALLLLVGTTFEALRAHSPRVERIVVLYANGGRMDLGAPPRHN